MLSEFEDGFGYPDRTCFTSDDVLFSWVVVLFEEAVEVGVEVA